MNLKNKSRKKRIRNLVLILTLTAMTLSIATFAWFIGMRTVNVTSFDVKIAATDDLFLSINGADWGHTVTITEDSYAIAYEGNTNWWGGSGLIPLSTIGEIDSSASRLVLYEKSSLTATPGGYRLMASRMNNTGAAEVKGYVAFDLFIKNLSGADYITELDILNEEAIYLSKESKVEVTQAGAEGVPEGGVPNTGIENSVRVAFAQIGRVKATDSTAQTIIGITCADDEDEGITGICTRTAQIWEPNDKAHVQGAISWYSKTCLKRTGDDLTLKGSYGEPCDQIVNDQAYPTYAVAKKIGATDQVDIYDGEAYNGYEDSITEGFLVKFPYFTDTMKEKKGTERPEFMYLAPNSVTKVRVYIYIEGQDIDNYDFASIGKSISVEFGFTKQRLTKEDIDYVGPDFDENENPIEVPEQEPTNP